MYSAVTVWAQYHTLQPQTRLSKARQSRGFTVAAVSGHTRQMPWLCQRSVCGGRTWWAHFEFTRINTTPTILCKEIEEQITLGAFSRFSTRRGLCGSQLTKP